MTALGVCKKVSLLTQSFLLAKLCIIMDLISQMCLHWGFNSYLHIMTISLVNDSFQHMVGIAANMVKQSTSDEYHIHYYLNGWMSIVYYLYFSDVFLMDLPQMSFLESDVCAAYSSFN